MVGVDEEDSDRDTEVASPACVDVVVDNVREVGVDTWTHEDRSHPVDVALDTVEVDSVSHGEAETR